MQTKHSRVAKANDESVIYVTMGVDCHTRGQSSQGLWAGAVDFVVEF